MADPRGCDYRDIEVGTGKIWTGDGGVVKTRGWVIPGYTNVAYAVGWNGLIYTVVSQGVPWDWRADARASLAQAGPHWQQALPEGLALAPQTCLPVKRLG